MKKRRQSKLKCRKGRMYRIRRGEFMRKSKLKGAEYLRRYLEISRRL